MGDVTVAVTQMAQMLLAARRGHAAGKAYAKALLALSAIFARLPCHDKTPMVSDVPPVLSLAHSLSHSLTHSLTHSFIHLRTHSPTNSPTHSLTH